jgi:hypothetical protein
VTSPKEVSKLIQDGIADSGYIEQNEAYLSDSQQSDDDENELNHIIEMSQCLDVFNQEQPTNVSQMSEIFSRHLVGLDEFLKSPHSVVQSENLVVRIARK